MSPGSLISALKARHPGRLALALLVTAQLALSADEFDTLRLKWRDMLTFSTNATLTDSNYSGWILSVGNSAQNYWNSMIVGPSRTCLWNDLNGLATNSSQITASYTRLRAMALGYAVHSSSVETNAQLRSAIISGLDWLYSNCYNESKSEYDNWFDWEIGTPLQLNDAAVLLYDGLSGRQLTNYMNAVEHFTPVPNLTGANEVWKASVVAVRGTLVKDSAKLGSARQALSDIFPYVNAGDGFYLDGSFVFHSIFAYNGGYGKDLLETLGPLMQFLKGSRWEITDPLQTNVFRWIYDAYEPFIYRGACMQMVSGRTYTRTGDDHRDGHEILASILRLAQFAPAGDAAAYKSRLKFWFKADSSRSFPETAPPPGNVWANAILNDANVVPAPEPTGHFQFAHMDRVVHLRPGWGVGLAMSSSRIGNFECIRNENLRGWHTGDGMVYLYNNDLEHFGDQFWSTVNPYRLPGTTVDTQTRTNGTGEGYLSSNAWVGGASIENRYGLAGMQLNAWNSSLAAKKSWFMFDDKVVCLGSGITSTDGRSIETIVENRRLSVSGNNPLFVNGVQKSSSVGWSETLTNVSWIHLGGNVPGADLGYWFPQPVTAKALREARSGSFYDLNTTYGPTNRVTRNFFTLWFDHGLNPSNATYAYVLLPNWSAAQTASFSANPSFTILENSTKAQGVLDTGLGITGINFWRDGTNKVGAITVDRKAAVIMRNNATILELGVSDPTQTNTGAINVEISLPASAQLSADNGVSLIQLNPTIKLAINVNGAAGQTRCAQFFVGTVQTNTLLPVADAYVQSGDQTNTNFGTAQTLAVKASGALLRETYLRFELPPAPGLLLNAMLRLMPVTVNDPALYHALSPVSDDSWTETGITWDSIPASGPAFTNWMLPPAGTAVQVLVTDLAQQAAETDGRLSMRIFSTGTPRGAMVTPPMPRRKTERAPADRGSF